MLCKLKAFLESRLYRRYPVVAVCVFLLLISGCASPSALFDRYAEQEALGKTIMRGRNFEHAVYEKHKDAVSSRELHIYIGSDGTPWDQNRHAADPTPRNPLALRLMLADAGPAIYLGRPCYHGVGSIEECTSPLWTSARYSEPVIASMAAVIKDLSDERRVDRVVLIGYSGGGAIASLLAARLGNVSTLITVAANLDTDAWTTAHSYEPLFASLNPAQTGPIPQGVRQIHLYGASDSNVPHETTLAFLARNSNARAIEYPDFTHACCWESVWSRTLSALLLEPDD